MLQIAYVLAKIGADTAENERNFAENLPKTGNYPAGPLPYGRKSRNPPEPEMEADVRARFPFWLRRKKAPRNQSPRKTTALVG